MPHLDYVDPDDTEPTVRGLLEADAETYGRPSLFARAMAHNPPLLEARQRYVQAVVENSGLEPTLVELATVAVSATNGCDYCVASHVEHLVKQLDVPAETARAVARGEDSGLDDRERAVVRLARQVAADSAAVGPEDVEALRAAGIDDAGIVGAVTACATAVSANVIADALGLDPADRPATFAGRDDR